MRGASLRLQVLVKTIPLVVGALCIALSVSQEPPASPAPQVQLDEESQSCMACHAEEVDGRPAVKVEAILSSPHAAFGCTSCHASITDTPHTKEMMGKKPACADCHTDQHEALAKSTHSREDYVAGDHPTCASCHGNGDSHAIVAGSKWTREQKVAVCTNCHSQTQRMKRYKVDPDAVDSYHESFHGKALLRFGNLRTAICTDCHGHHDVLSPQHPAAPTHAHNVAATCGQAGCHPGAKGNFALSGANHLRLKVKGDLLLQVVLGFFRVLIFGTIGFMVLSTALDLHKVVLRSQEPPRCGRLAGVFIGLSFLSLVAAIVLVTLRAPAAGWALGAMLGFLGLALIAYALRPKALRKARSPATYLRMNLNLRLQHLLLMISMTLLLATGLPLRFASYPVSVQEMSMLGGLEASRVLHRVAAIGLIVVAVWHLAYLIVRWRRAGWSLRSWTMLPNRKDVQDFVLVTKGYLGLTREEPQFDRYTFRSKIDYLAEYWGVPVMVSTGFVLWFPMYFSTRLPADAWPVAFIAHGYEATLAFLAIISWHLYNVLLHPDKFPFNLLWITGRLTREEMEREHPLELARIEAADTPNGELSE